MLIIGVDLLWGARQDLVYHIPSYFKGPSYLYPWQGIVGGGLSSAFGLFMIIHGFCRKKKPPSNI